MSYFGKEGAAFGTLKETIGRLLWTFWKNRKYEQFDCLLAKFAV